MPAAVRFGPPAPEPTTGLTLAELIAALAVGLAAGLVVSAYVVHALGRPIDPRGMLVLWLAEAALAASWVSRASRRHRAGRDAAALGGFGLVVVGIFLYVLWLAGPTLLPVTRGGDVVHHASLVDFIVRERGLPRDPSLGAYLGEFLDYPAGSHILAALAAAWFGTDSLRLLHPVLAAMVALKAGIVYNLISRLVLPSGQGPLVAVAGSALLLLAHDYFLGSIVDELFFYAQVVSETFAIAMLWILVVWWQRPSNGLLALFALCGIAVWLTWPVWVSIPVATLAGLLLLRGQLSPREKLGRLAYAVGPIAVVAVAYSVGKLRSVRIIKGEGDVLAASVEAFGWPLICLAIVGLMIGLRQRRMLPVALFAGAGVAQAAVLFALGAYYGQATYYQAYKQFYLLLYPLVLFAALALDAWPGLVGRFTTATWRVRRAALAVPSMLVLGLALQQGLAFRPRPMIVEPLYQAGLWARAHLPRDRVDYLVDDVTTGYWLHIQMLGNARASSRTEAVFYEGGFRARRAEGDEWNNPEGLPFAIVGDLRTVPETVRPRLRVLYEAGPSAVVHWQDVAHPLP